MASQVRQIKGSPNPIVRNGNFLSHDTFLIAKRKNAPIKQHHSSTWTSKQENFMTLHTIWNIIKKKARQRMM